jgi:predicted nuclease of predicted toxin-antitoxin system
LREDARVGDRPAILDTAIAEARVIVTADLDFPRLLASLGAHEPGLILLRGGNYSDSESIECVWRVVMAVPENRLPHSIVVVDRERIRRRSLPV